MREGMLTLLTGTLLVHRPSVSATRRASAMVHGIALHAGDARCRGITSGTARIPADDITTGEILTGQVSAITDETGLVGHTEGTATDIAELDAFIIGESVTHVTGLTGRGAVADEAVFYVDRAGWNTGLGVAAEHVIVHAGGTSGH